MSKFDFSKGLIFFMVITSWVSAGYCSKWFGLAGERVPGPHANRTQLCMLVDEVVKLTEVNPMLIELCNKPSKPMYH